MKLEDIEKLCDEATRGRWQYIHSRGKVAAIDIDNGYAVCNPIDSDFDLEQSINNAKFIAASRTLMPKLLAVAKAANECCERACDCCADDEHWHNKIRETLEELEKE